MIFLSHYPDVTDARDGMSQRIAAIDSIFKDVERTYLHISFRGHKRRGVRIQGRVRVETLNFYLHHTYIIQCLRRARFVYVHTAHNAVFIAPYLKYLHDKLILDLHGIVPEETAFLGQANWAWILGRVERYAVSNSRLTVVVTERMAQHILGKYPGCIDASRILLLPNVEARREGQVSLPSERKRHDGTRLIYAGTVGAWQKTDLMLQALSRALGIHANLQAYLYVHPDYLAGLQEEVKRLDFDDRVTLGCLRHEDVLREYAKADVGLVLRDDILLNRVAMPTKLAEYMSHGVVPIVLSPDLGDFLRYGYRYLTIEDLDSVDKLNPETLEEMRLTNIRIMASIFAQAEEARSVLRSFVTGRQPNSTS